MISKYEDIKKAGEYLQEHTRKYHLELNRGFNKFKAPLGISLVVSIIAMLISVIIYSNRYKIAPEILWDKNYFNLALICIVYIFSFTSIIILMINAGDYLRSLNLIQYLKSKEFVLSLRIKKSLVFYVKIILLCTTMSLHSKSRVNRFIKTILGIITFIIKLPKIYVFAVPFLYTLFFWLILHGQPENALLLLQLWAIIGIFSIFSSDETRSYIFVCLSVNYFVFCTGP
ncbi:hypothetical protein [Candidatus Odyssella thessalonicensis]|uniref:hypothetical protein n=1 Tax=Candidatus Odyssella thessalonicensis TaxID=84647 RepID=UPI000225B17F|nr:hypothetical protein [Candidatus Odyssella thessalonicensis]